MPAPNVPEDVSDLLRRMQAEIRDLQGRVNIRPAQNEVLGSVTVGTGGAFKVLDADGQTLFWVGGIAPANPDGSPQRGTLIYRDDGTPALQLARIGGTMANPQVFTVRDSKGNTILAEDLAGGLALPWLAYPTPGEEDTTRWPKTNSGTWATIGRSRGITLSPRLRYHAAVTADGGSTGQIRLLVDGTVVATGASMTALIGTVALPGYTVGAEVEFQLQAQTLTGGGYTYGICRYLYGVQS